MIKTAIVVWQQSTLISVYAACHSDLSRTMTLNWVIVKIRCLFKRRYVENEMCA